MRHLGTAVPVLAVVLTVASPSVPARERTDPVVVGWATTTVPGEGCALAWTQELSFPEEVTIDQVRVDLSSDDPLAAMFGMSRVEVESGGLGRVLRVAFGGRWGVRFDPGLRGRTFRVSLDPVFTARTNACVERIALLRAGEVVAVVRP